MATGCTPGPWHTFRTERTDYRGVEINNDIGLTVAYVVKFVPEYAAESAANARLISAAPELFEALEAAKFWIGMQERQSPELGLLIDKALAKVSGEAVSA